MKNYNIAGIEFSLKTDLELDESIEISNLLKGLFAESNNIVAGRFTGEDMKKLLSILLEPVDKKSLPESFTFGKTKESVQVEIFKDFFLERMEKASNTAKDFVASIVQQ